LTIEPTENQEILTRFHIRNSGDFQRKQDSDYPGKACTVGRKLSPGWSYVEWNEKNLLSEAASGREENTE